MGKRVESEVMRTRTGYLRGRVATAGALTLALLVLPATSAATTRSTATAASTSKSSTPSASSRTSKPSKSSAALGQLSFASDTALAPPAIAVPVGASPSALQAPGYIFIAPQMDFARSEPFVGQPGPEIFEANGNLVWQDPLRGHVKLGANAGQLTANDFTTATYEGQPVLVWWQGYLTPQATGSGEWMIVNQHYRTIATVQAPRGYSLDLHEIQITPQGDAYVIAGRAVPVDLKGCCKGPARGEVYDQVIFEIEIKTGQIVWSWDPLHHIPLRDSYESLFTGKTTWNPYHLNSIFIEPSGNLVVSSRNTWAAYWIDRASPQSNGAVLATLGGKRSTFTLGRGARFAWQHDVRLQGANEVSLFDDEAGPAVGKQSRGLLLSLDWTRHTASVVHEYLLPHPKLAESQGNFEMEPGGNVFIGWGQLPFFSEYTASGELLYEGYMPGPDESYRAFREPWVGLPETSPSLLAKRGAHGGPTALYVSWNGATQVSAWQLLAGASQSSLTPSGQPVARQGFQTAISTRSPGPYYQVRALDASGQALGASAVVSSVPAPSSAKSAAAGGATR